MDEFLAGILTYTAGGVPTELTGHQYSWIDGRQGCNHKKEHKREPQQETQEPQQEM